MKKQKLIAEQILSKNLYGLNKKNQTSNGLKNHLQNPIKSKNKIIEVKLLHMDNTEKQES